MCLLVFVFGLGLGAKASAATKTVCGSGCDYTTIAAAESGATAGDTINVSAGTYKENNPTFSKALSWVATDGNGTVTIQNSGVGAYAAYFSGTASTIITVTGFVFDGELTKTTVITSAQSADKTFIDCTFKELKTGGYNMISIGDSGGTFTFTRPTVTESGTNFINTIWKLTGATTTLNVTNATVTSYLYGAVINASTTTGTTTISGGTYNLTSSNASVMFFNVGAMNGSVLISNATINWTGANKGLITTTGTGTGTNFTWLNNSMTSDTIGGSSLISIAHTAHAVSITGGNITYPGMAASKHFIYIADQVSPVVDGLKIYSTADTGGDAIVITATVASPYGTAQVKNCEVWDKTTGASHAIMVGTDSTSSGNNMLDGAIITGNKIYGASYYDDTIVTTNRHGILYGYNKDGTIKNNYVDGYGFGLVIKGAGDTYTSGGVENNIVKNSLYAASLMVKGQNNVPIYNNTFITNKTVSASYFALLNVKNGDSLDHATGALVKNNLFLGMANKDLIQFDAAATGFTFANNGYFTNTGTNPRWNIIGTGVSTTIADWRTVSNEDAAPSYFSDHLFTSSSNYHLQSTSPAIDFGNDVSLTTDYEDNSIYGLPDIGAYEYQPTKEIGTNSVYKDADITIYGNEKFRNRASESGGVIDFSLTLPGSTKTDYVNVDVNTWANTGTRQKTWTEDSTVSALTNTVHTIGDLEANKYYNVTVDSNTTHLTGSNCSAVGSNFVCFSNSSGKITFTYTGTYSTHTFNVEEGDNTGIITSASPEGSTYDSVQMVTLTCSNNGAASCNKTYYTLDGTTPTTSSTEYTTPITISADTTLKFFSTDTNGESELTKTEIYIFESDDEEHHDDLDISKVKAISIENSITVTWKTDHNAKSTVRYGTDKNLKEKQKEKKKTKKHKVVLNNLKPDTQYYFRIKAEDGDDNEDRSKVHVNGLFKVSHFRS